MPSDKVTRYKYPPVNVLLTSTQAVCTECRYTDPNVFIHINKTVTLFASSVENKKGRNIYYHCFGHGI